MNILIACDSFKDALNATAVCQAVQRGLLLANPHFNIRAFPLSDGGEGMAEVLDFHIGLQEQQVPAQDPLGRYITAKYGLSRDRQIAFIEMAQAAGLQLLLPNERNPLKTSTFGVGEMIADALEQGAHRIVLGIGGSATNDLGTGMAAALGWHFLDENGQRLLPTGGNLAHIRSLVPPAVLPSSTAVFEVICDVKNPLLGETGAAKIYARQKGASNSDIEKLESGAEHFTAMAAMAGTDPAEPGAGAAGGMGSNRVSKP
jgi:glycerate kinase